MAVSGCGHQFLQLEDGTFKSSDLFNQRANLTRENVQLFEGKRCYSLDIIKRKT